MGFPVLAGLSRETAKTYDLFFSEEKGYASLQSGALGRPSSDDLLRIVSRIQIA